MEGDSCSTRGHEKRMAVAYISTFSYGTDCCEECLSHNIRAKIHHYDLERAREIFNKNLQMDRLHEIELRQNDQLSIELSTTACEHWVLFGQDKINYLDNNIPNIHTYVALDPRSRYYDSSG